MRDKLGRITDKNETLAGTTTSWHYAYDIAGRLTDVQQNGTLVSHYEYDGNGNRTRAQYPLLAADLAATYDDQDRMLTYGPNSYTYTANGELASKTNAGGTTTYNYDVLGNLRSVTLPGGTVIEYLIDAQNRRIGKKVNGTLTQAFVYDGQLQIVAELDGSGNVVSRFVYGDRGNVPSYMTKGGVTYRIIAEQLGSPRFVINTSSGSVAQRIDYDEFGNILNDTSPGFQPFAFAGGLYDQHTRLIRLGTRDYYPEVGRWTARDPILFDGWDTNLYGYVFNDPINWLDLLGLQLTDAQIANILFNETRSLSGTNISQARENIAHAIINGDETLGNNRPRTAPTTANVPRGEQPAYAACEAAVAAARSARSRGSDPTRGAIYFNFRNTNSTANFQNESIQTQVGPLNSSYTRGGLNSTGVYANTYGGRR
jgi:RHS repeat-associated protein